jgi:hypothetical protein
VRVVTHHCVIAVGNKATSGLGLWHMLTPSFLNRFGSVDRSDRSVGVSSDGVSERQ